MNFQFKRHFPILVIFLGAAGLIGCASTDSQSNGRANAPVNAQATAQSGVKAPPRVEIKSGDKVGVAECDEYLEKYEACAKNNVPEPGRAAMLSSIEEMRKSWITVAVHSETRANLAKDCKQNQEATKQNLRAYVCAW